MASTVLKESLENLGSEKLIFEKNIQELTCSICYNALAQCLILPCSHVFSCKNCINNLEKQNCSFCRTRILGTVLIKSDFDDLNINFETIN